MKLFAYAVREFDEKPLFDKWCAKLGVEFAYSTEYPTPENIELARGYDAISTTPYALGPEAIRRFHELGVKYLGARAIGFDHFDLPTAKELGMPVTHVFYPPSGVANYAIMFMLMCCRKMRQILDRNVVQDYTLEGKMGKELSNSTVAVLGTGKIGGTVIRHLSGFGCRLLAYDLYQNPEVAQMAEYADLETIWREADIITLHMPANPEDHHIINHRGHREPEGGGRRPGRAGAGERPVLRRPEGRPHPQPRPGPAEGLPQRDRHPPHRLLHRGGRGAHGGRYGQGPAGL